MFAIIPLWAFGVGLIALIAGIFATLHNGSRGRTKRLVDREIFSMEVIYDRFFASENLSKPLVLELWSEVAVTLGIPPGKLRPTDRFDKELAPVEAWDDDIVEVQWAAERRLKKTGSKADLSGVQTLGDYVHFFCKLESSKRVV